MFSCSVIGRHPVLHCMVFIVSWILTHSMLTQDIFSEKYFISMLIFVWGKKMVYATCLYLFSSCFCEISVGVYGDSLAFSVQIYNRKQPAPGTVIKPLLSSGSAKLDSWVLHTTSDFSLFFSCSKSKRSFVAVFMLSVECLVQFQTNPSTAPHQRNKTQYISVVFSEIHADPTIRGSGF